MQVIVDRLECERTERVESKKDYNAKVMSESRRRSPAYERGRALVEQETDATKTYFERFGHWLCSSFCCISSLSRNSYQDLRFTERDRSPRSDGRAGRSCDL